MLPYFMKILTLGHHVVLNLAYGLCTAFLGSDKVAGRIYGYFVEFVYERAGHRVNDGNLFNLVAEEFYPDGIFPIAYADVDRISSYPEGSSLEISFRTTI